MEQQYDVIVIGGGAGGYAAAVQAHRRGLRIALVEQDVLGGTCLHRGCISTKAMLQSAHIAAMMREADQYGVKVPAGGYVDFSRVQARQQAIVERLYAAVRSSVERRGITWVQGVGRLVRPTIFSPTNGAVAVEQGAHTVTLYATQIVLATGARARSLSSLPIDGVHVFNSDQLLQRQTLPGSIVIVGGGAIGIEWASMLCDFGVDVTLLECAPQVLPREDAQIAERVRRQLVQRGVRIVTSVSVLGQERDAQEDGMMDVLVRPIDATAQSTVPERIRTECVLVAVGRVPQTQQLGLEHTRIVVQDEAIVVNEWMQTHERHIYAIGDVTGGLQLAHVASVQGELAIDHLCGVATMPYDVRRMPRCVYGRPEVAAIGWTEQEARAQGLDPEIVIVQGSQVAKALIEPDALDWMKVLVDRATRQLLGVHLVGNNVGEWIAIASLAMVVEATVWELGGLTVYPHPSLTEAWTIAGRAHDWDVCPV